MTDEPTILVEIHGSGVALIRLNRPGVLNALNSGLAVEMAQAIRRIEADPDIGAMVITGTDRAFAAGADVAEMADLTAERMEAEGFLDIWAEFANARKPKIAAVNGLALGGGCELVMMCDFAIAGEGARFGQPEVRLGVIAGLGGTQRLPRLVGRALAMDLHLTGRLMGAAEALRSGLVARVVPDAEVVDTALAAGRAIAAHSRPAVQLAREMVALAEEMPLSQGLLAERHRFRQLFGTPDQQEGMRAFLEKRAPEFRRQAAFHR